MPTPIYSGRKSGAPVSAIPGRFYDEVANRFNFAQGLDGVRLEVNAQGGLVARLGNDEYSYRTITTCEPSIVNGSLNALVFKKIRCLCSKPDGAPVIVPMTSDGDGVIPVFTDGVLVALKFGKQTALAANNAEAITEVPVVEGGCTQA